MSTIISSMMGYIMQQGAGKSLLGGIGKKLGFGGGKGSSSVGGIGHIQSMLSKIGTVNPNHPLVQRIQQDTGLQNPQQVTQYTQQTINLMNEHAKSNPQELQSLFSKFLGGG